MVFPTFHEMEKELTCGVCSEFFKDPVTLPCSHSICFDCAPYCLAIACATSTIVKDDSVVESQMANNKDVFVVADNFLHSLCIQDTFDCCSEDSGYVSTQEFHSCLQLQNSRDLRCLKCPRCGVRLTLDERGVHCLPRNQILNALVKARQKRASDVDCQLCEVSPPAKATVTCEQCQVSYCHQCLKLCHPKRGPLAHHTLISPVSDNYIIHSPSKQRGVLRCNEHEEESISMFCAHCTLPVCYLCFEEGRHHGHDAKALGVVYKEQKAEMRKSLGYLTEHISELQQFIRVLNEQTGKLQENGVDFEARVVAQIDSILENLNKKKLELLSHVSAYVSRKAAMLTQQSDECQAALADTDGLVQYTEEVLKEADPARFLMISSSLLSRLSRTFHTRIGKKGFRPVASSDIELKLSVAKLLSGVEKFTFVEGSDGSKYDVSPCISTEKCSVTNNTFTLCWYMPADSCHVDSFIVEIDDGMKGELQNVHRTSDFECTLGGLQFNSTYRARVRACADESVGAPSEIVYLTTPAFAVFRLDPRASHEDICLSNDRQTVSCSSFENRVAMSDVGFSRGCHYWEVTVDKYEGNPDPAIGVAQEDCFREAVLGRDDKAWAIYIDSSRSWFQHNNEHLFRFEGGVRKGSTLGLLLDLDHCKLTFFCNGDRRGPVEFPSLSGVDLVYPAFSLNRNVALTLRTGLAPPN